MAFVAIVLYIGVRWKIDKLQDQIKALESDLRMLKMRNR